MHLKIIHLTFITQNMIRGVKLTHSWPENLMTIHSTLLPNKNVLKFAKLTYSWPEHINVSHLTLRHPELV